MWYKNENKRITKQINNIIIVFIIFFSFVLQAFSGAIDIPLDVSKYYEYDGISFKGLESEDSFDSLKGDGASYPAEKFPEAGIKIFNTDNFGKVKFLIPSKKKKNYFVFDNQEINIPKDANPNVLFLYGAGVYGNQDGIIEFKYENNDKSEISFIVNDWCNLNEDEYQGIIMEFPYRYEDGKEISPNCGIFLIAVPIPDKNSKVVSFKLIENENIHIFGITLSKKNKKVIDSILASENMTALREKRKELKLALVGIFKDKNFPYCNSEVTPDILKEKFEEAGISVKFLNYYDVEDENILNVKNYKVFINAYGNTFPVTMLKTIEKFRKDGGVFVNTGVPLTHPIKKVKRYWKDLGHSDEYHDKLNTGGFVDSENFRISKNRLFIKKIGLENIPWMELETKGGKQGLNINSLRDIKRVKKILSVGRLPYAAIIYHNDGMIDIWGGTFPLSSKKYYSEDSLIGLQSEVIVRIVSYILQEKEILDESKYEKIISRKFSLERADKTTPFYLKDRKYLYPKKKVSENLIVLDIRGMNSKEKILFTSLQGIINKDKAKIFLISKEDDEFWLEYLKKKGYIKEYEKVGKGEDLLKRYKYKKAVLVDRKLYGSLNIATIISGMEKLLIASDNKTVEKYGLKVKMDLRGKWKDIVEAYREIWKKYSDRINKEVIAIYAPKDDLSPLRDYLIANNIFTFWITGSIDGSKEGRDTLKEKRFFKQLFTKEYPVNIPVLGYPWAGEGVGIGEHRGVSFLSSCAKFLVPSDWIANLSILSGFENKELAQHKSRKIKLDKDKVYLSFVVTDGDNLCTWYDYFKKYWDELPEDRNYSVGWTMGPSIYDLMPPVAEYFINRLHNNDSIGAAVSGVGYIYMKDYGAFYRNYREEVVNDFIKITSKYMQDLDEKWTWIMYYGGYGSEYLEYYADIEGIKAVMGGYGRSDSPSDVNKLTEVVNDVVVFHSATDATKKDKTLKEIVEVVSKLKPPVFLHIQISNWETKGNELNELGKELIKKGYIIVKPEELGELYLKYMELE